MTIYEDQKGAAKWVILIGINYYMNGPDGDPRPPIFNLAGCVEDVNAMEAYFRNSLGLETDHIFKLISTTRPEGPPSKWPTYQNIIDTIRFVGVEKKPSPNDLVYIHFSGHGTKLKKSGGQYGLVPMDAKEKQKFLTGAELKELLDEMLDKQLVVTVVLDCCHSSGAAPGGAHRGGGDQGVVVAARGLDDIESILWGNTETEDAADEEAEILQGESLDDDTGRGMRTFGHWLTSTNGEYTVIAACREVESAYEVRVLDGKIHGALTHCLLCILKNNDALVSGLSSLSYWRLQWHLAATVRRLLEPSRNQNVLITGATYRAFFDNKQLGLLTAAPIITELETPAGIGTRVWLNTSEHLGAKVGTKFTVYPLTDADIDGQRRPSDRLACCEVKSIRSGRTEAVWTELFTPNPKQLVVGCPSVPQNVKGEKLVRQMKRAAGPDAKAKAMDQALREAWTTFTPRYATLVPDSWPERTCLQVAVNDKYEYQLLDEDGAVISMLGPNLSTENETAAIMLVNRIMHMAKFFSVRDLRSKPQDRSLVRIQVLGTIPRDSELSNRKPHRYQFSAGVPSYIQPWQGVTTGSIDYNPKELIVLGIDNVSAKPLHLTVIGLDTSDWSIDGVHPVAKPLVPEMLHTNYRLQIAIGTPVEDEACQTKVYTETIKVFVTTEPVDFSVLFLGSLEEDGPGRGESQQEKERDFWRVYEGLMNSDVGLPVLNREVLSDTDPNRNARIRQKERRAVNCGMEDLIIRVVPDLNGKGEADLNGRVGSIMGRHTF